MTYEVIDIFRVGNDTVVTLNVYGVGVNMKKPLVGDDGRQYQIVGVGMLAGEDPNREYPLDLLVKGQFNCKSADITTA